MAEATKSRFSVDLDHIEPQLSQSAQQAAPQKDPLAELARIVGQDDPFRALLDMGQAKGQATRPDPARQPAREPAPVSAPALPAVPAASAYEERWEPEYEIEPEPYHPAPAQPAPYQGYTLRGQAPGDDWGQGQADPGAALNVYPSHQVADDAYGAYMPVDPGFASDRQDQDSAAYGYAEQAPAAPRRSRKGLMAVGAALGVAVLGVGGTFAFRNHKSVGAANGEPPVVKADASPVKVAPQNPGGVEIPDQNKQIYEGAGQDGQTKIVSREEQPLDVRQAARVASAGGALPAGVGAPASPPSGAISAALGEPRRVRTVAVGPDGGMKASDQGASRPTGAAPAATASAPSSTPAALPPQRPRDMPSTTPQSAAAKPPVASAPEATPSAPAAPKRVAAAPQAIAEPAETGNTQAASGGGYVVQLAVRPSEKEAKTAFAQLQQRHASELAGKAPAIRKAEVNGGTVYRVRVGPMAKDEASGLCSRLQASGGQCFVAKN